MTTANKIGIIAIAITVTNLVDEILAERGFIPNEQVRSITLDAVFDHRVSTNAISTTSATKAVRTTTYKTSAIILSVLPFDANSSIRVLAIALAVLLRFFIKLCKLPFCSAVKLTHLFFYINLTPFLRSLLLISFTRRSVCDRLLGRPKSLGIFIET